MGYQRLMDIDIFLVIGIIGFLIQAGIITYSIKLMSLSWRFRKWRKAWIIWTVAQLVITCRRLYTLHLIMQECNESILVAQYKPWLYDNIMLIVLSLLYFWFMKIKYDIFSEIHNIQVGRPFVGPQGIPGPQGPQGVKGDPGASVTQ